MSTNSPTSTSSKRKKVTTNVLRTKKQRGQPISMLTAYDYPTALAIDQAGLDVILVGDSLGMVMLGYENTLPVTMEAMLHHCKAVSRGANYALLVGDMPFMSYQAAVADAIRNAGRFLQEGGMDAVKLEGGQPVIPTIRAIIDAGIPVMGHLGLTPQSVNQLGGFSPQGRDALAAQRLAKDAKMLQEAGCFSIVLESVPERLGAFIAASVEIPIIGIGAGSGCDGQVLVTHDLLGLFKRFTPRFVKKYANLYDTMTQAFTSYKSEVEAGIFPAPEHCVQMPDQEWQKLMTLEGAVKQQSE